MNIWPPGFAAACRRREREAGQRCRAEGCGSARGAGGASERPSVGGGVKAGRCWGWKSHRLCHRGQDPWQTLCWPPCRQGELAGLPPSPKQIPPQPSPQLPTSLSPSASPSSSGAPYQRLSRSPVQGCRPLRTASSPEEPGGEHRAFFPSYFFFNWNLC